MNCPYCEAEKNGVSNGWGMSPEGWESMRKQHDNHPPQEDCLAISKQAGEEKEWEKIFELNKNCGCTLGVCKTCAHWKFVVQACLVSQLDKLQAEVKEIATGTVQEDYQEDSAKEMQRRVLYLITKQRES